MMPLMPSCEKLQIDDISRWASRLLPLIEEVRLVCLFGDIGTGKTTLVKEWIHNLSGVDRELITSPTFLIRNSYSFREGQIHHYDFYLRMDKASPPVDEWDEIGEGDICFIEWPHPILGALEGHKRIDVSLEHSSDFYSRIVNHVVHG